MCKIASKLYEYTSDQLQVILDNSNSYADVLRKCGMSPHGSNRRTLNKIINEYNLNLEKISLNRQHDFGINKAIKPIPLEEILIENSTYKSSSLLKRLVKSGFKENKCEKCGIKEWNGKPISFHLHHKNGNHNDNRLENLESLCPNCHSQTDNYAGKKNKIKVAKNKSDEQKKAFRGVSFDGTRLYDGYGNYKIKCPKCKNNWMNRSALICRSCYDEERKKPKVPKEDLFKLLENNSHYTTGLLLGVGKKTIERWIKYYEIGFNIPSKEELEMRIYNKSFAEIGKEYGVTGTTIRRWCKKYNLPYRKVDIKNMAS